MKKKFVLGILLNADDTQVALILKTHPDFLAGKLNGPGGQVEPGETLEAALTREIIEECGVTIAPQEWALIGHMEDDKSVISVFSCHNESILAATTKTEEQVFVMPVDDPRVAQMGLSSVQTFIARARQRESREIVHLPTNYTLWLAARSASASAPAP